MARLQEQRAARAFLPPGAIPHGSTHKIWTTRGAADISALGPVADFLLTSPKPARGACARAVVPALGCSGQQEPCPCPTSSAQPQGKQQLCRIHTERLGTKKITNWVSRNTHLKKLRYIAQQDFKNQKPKSHKMVYFNLLFIYQASKHRWTTTDILQASADRADINLHRQKISAAI